MKNCIESYLIFFVCSGDEREVEAKDVCPAEDVPRLEHRHEEVHHRRPEGKGKSRSNQNYKIGWIAGNFYFKFIKFILFQL